MTQVNWLTKEEQKVVDIIVKPLTKKLGFALAHIGDELTSTDIESAVKERTIMLTRLHLQEPNESYKLDIQITCREGCFTAAAKAHRERQTNPKVLEERLDEIANHFYSGPVNTGCVRNSGGMPEYFELCNLYEVLRQLLSIGCVSYDCTDGGEDFNPMIFFALGTAKRQHITSGIEVCISVVAIERGSTDW